jgi:hypothetical protein
VFYHCSFSCLITYIFLLAVSVYIYMYLYIDPIKVALFFFLENNVEFLMARLDSLIPWTDSLVTEHGLNKFTKLVGSSELKDLLP